MCSFDNTPRIPALEADIAHGVLLSAQLICKDDNFDLFMEEWANYILNIKVRLLLEYKDGQ